MRYALFLDDERFPPGSIRGDLPWVVARSYGIAVNIIQAFGFPQFVSFDHDLGEDRSGMDFAKFIVSADSDSCVLDKDFAFDVHSMNPIGAENIRSLMNSYLSQRGYVQNE